MKSERENDTFLYFCIGIHEHTGPMTNIFAQIRIILRSIPAYSKSRIRQIIAYSILLGLLIWAFVLCNRIPSKSVSMDIHSFGPKNVSYAISLPLGQNSNLKEFPDSLFQSVFSKSGRDGISFSVNAGSIPYSADLGYNELGKYKEKLRSHYPNDSIDVLNGLVNVDFRIENNIHRLSIDGKGTYSPREPIQKLDTEVSPLGYQITELDSSGARYAFGGSLHVCYKDTLSGIIDIPSPHSNSKRFFYNDSVWSFNDVSQAYVGIKLNGHRTVFNKDNGSGGNGLFRGMKTRITIDFAAPVEFSNMNPEPDVVTMTGLMFNDPDKIVRLSSEGLFFHVSYLENKNFQSMKMFVLTAAITALATLIISLIYKLIRYSLHRKKREKENVNL